MKLQDLIPGRVYHIDYLDTDAPDYTWYSGDAKFIRKHKDKFGTKEVHGAFLVDGDECYFPLSSVFQKSKSSKHG